MSTDDGPNKLQRMLGRRLWGNPKPRSIAHLDDLSVTDQQRVLTRVAEEHRTVLITFLSVGQFVVVGAAAGLGGSINSDGSATNWMSIADLTLHAMLWYFASLAVWWSLALNLDRVVDRIMRLGLKKDRRVDTRYLNPPKPSAFTFGHLVAGVALVGFLATGPFLGFVFAAVAVLTVCLYATLVYGSGWLFANRFGADECCRQCAYSLPWDDALPSKCPECGLDLSEPWRRVRGRHASRPLAVSIAVAMQTVPLLVALV